MSDTLIVGDHIIVNKYIFAPAVYPLTFPSRSIHRGDIIVFRYPKNPATDYVKRVIGLPGEKVTIRDKRVLIDGRELPEPYKRLRDPQTYPLQPALPEPWRSRDQFGPFVVPFGHYFVLGDNRDQSNDSRYWGTVPKRLVKGRALLVYWSFERYPPVPTTSTFRERALELGTVLKHFVSETRWERTFMVIDGEYRYDDDGSPAS